MKKFLNSFFVILLVISFFSTSIFIGCQNPFIDNIVPEAPSNNGENIENPDNPDTPDNPSTPDNPDTPDNPSNPDNPGTPDNPNEDEEEIIITNAEIPAITEQPKDFNGEKPEALELKVTATVSDGGTLSYQQYKNGAKIEGATAATYSIPKDELIGTIEYYVVVINTNNNVNGNKVASVTSNKTIVTVITNAETPVITSQPQNKSVDDGKTFDLSVNAKSPDNGVLTYQWYIAKDSSSEGDLISGATNSTLSTKYDLKNSYVSEDVYYYVVVTNTNNNVNGVKTAQVTSNRVKVTVNVEKLDGNINIDFNQGGKINEKENSNFTFITYFSCFRL